MATAGDVNADGYADVVIGAPNHYNPVGTGRAYLFMGSASGLPSTPQWIGASSEARDYGQSVSEAGDVNGDGYDDVIIGAPYLQDATGGIAYVYLGSPDGLSRLPDWSARSDQSDTFGSSVGSAGDVNGDGYDDVIIGAPSRDDGEYLEGAAYVFLGSATGLADTPVWVVEGDAPYARLGASVSGAGDVNADGFGDVIVGAYTYDNGFGRAFVYLGSPEGVATTPVWTGKTNQGEAFFGWSVDSAGDVDSDGFDDIVVGAIYYQDGQVHEGAAFLYLGSPSGPSVAPDWTAEGNHEGASFGWSVGSAGDVNGDGYQDVIVGAPYGSPFGGVAVTFFGSASGLQHVARMLIAVPVASLLGTSVGSAGDVDADGFADEIVGAPHTSHGIWSTEQGLAVVALGHSG